MRFQHSGTDTVALWVLHQGVTGLKSQGKVTQSTIEIVGSQSCHFLSSWSKVSFFVAWVSGHWLPQSVMMHHKLCSRFPIRNSVSSFELSAHSGCLRRETTSNLPLTTFSHVKGRRTTNCTANAHQTKQ